MSNPKGLIPIGVEHEYFYDQVALGVLHKHSPSPHLYDAVSENSLTQRDRNRVGLEPEAVIVCSLAANPKGIALARGTDIRRARSRDHALIPHLGEFNNSPFWGICQD